MLKIGKKAIEDEYGIVLSNKGPYYAQLSYLDQSGELANTKKLAVILFKLCEVVDSQIDNINSLQRELSILKTHSFDETNTPSAQ